MKLSRIQRKALAVTIAVLTAIVLVGTLGAVPHWGELATPVFLISLGGL
jgi:hypothetical protein